MKPRVAFVLAATGIAIVLSVISASFPGVSHRFFFALYSFLTMLSLKICGVDAWPNVGWPRTIAMGGVSAVTAYAAFGLLSRFNLPRILDLWVSTGKL
jgi:hypothetical protein